MPALRYVQRFDRNARGRDWVVGDVHGCFTTLELALEEIGFDPMRDRLFCVGDLIDRGPESPRALEFLDRRWFHTVRGNHEQFLLDTDPEDRQAVYLWWVNGGQWFFDQPPSVQQAFREAVARLPYAIEVETKAGTVGIVHADVPRRLGWPGFIARVEAGDPDALETAIWSRSRATGRVTEGVAGIYRVFCGHTPVRGGVRTVGNVFCIDTGAVYGLTNALPDTGLTLMPLTGDWPHTREVVFPGAARAARPR